LAALAISGMRAQSEEPAPAQPTQQTNEPAQAAEKQPAAGVSVEELVEAVRKSIVVITYSGRDGKREGLGTGFVVAPDGLIATNLHVIGEARPISVETNDGRRHEVAAIHASDRMADLALLRIAADGLTPLELADSDSLKQGQPVVAVGNPLGLTHSVVTGVVSGQREIDGRKMIQLAIPIEPGNSGGPLMDMEGRVHGLLTMKSAVTANLGFAVPSNRLKPLLEKPNPISMERWLLIGALDPMEWKPLFGARWRQRGGRVTVDGAGAGFGGRSLCLSQEPIPELPYEVAVVVKLDDESGAAGIAFGSDGADRHFGFYPSAGSLRLSRFDGPDVTSWQVLEEKPSPHYRPGDWNRLKVRVEAEKVQCFVNDHLVIESTQVRVPAGLAGLAKFRTTQAEFKQYRQAKQLDPPQPSDELLGDARDLLKELPPSGALGGELVDRLSTNADANIVALRELAQRLERQSSQLKKMALAVHHQRVLDQLARLLDVEHDREIDLFHAALLIARLDQDELDVDAYRDDFQRMAKELKSQLPEQAGESEKLNSLNEFLFEANGFHGSRADYYNRANSYVNQVLDDREGLPITLSLIYMELAREIGLNVVGVGLPGHFIVKFIAADGKESLIDVFESGRTLSREQANQRVQEATGRALNDDDLKPASSKAILVRMLHNLRGIAGRGEEPQAMLRYLDAILTISPDSPEDRMYRAFFRYRSGMGPEALEDIAWLLEHEPEGINLDRVRELRQVIENSAR
jgi:regulator of sirC expression with transglutaminase-like and TPR domain/S1-C subfamily serine protease